MLGSLSAVICNSLLINFVVWLLRPGPFHWHVFPDVCLLACLLDYIEPRSLQSLSHAGWAQTCDYFLFTYVFSHVIFTT